jgi:hypothetical protein
MATVAHLGFSGAGVAAYGDAESVNNFAGMTLAAPAVAMAATPDGHGYWVTAADGGVFAFGSAPYLGSMGGTSIFAPVVAMASAPDGGGYWLAAADGGVFAFGDAPFYGSMGGKPLNEPVVGMAATPDGKGYWLVAADGGVFAFGDAGFHGSAANVNLGTSVVGMAATPDGNGYWLAAATAAVLPFGDAVSYGPSPNEPPFPPTAAIAATPDGKGYWLLQPDSISTSFTSPDGPANGAAGQSAVQIAASQIGPDPDDSQGAFCNPYGPCEEWCALFATWVWNEIGVPIPRYGFVGAVFDWADQRGLAQGTTSTPAPGDVVLYGTGPQNVVASPHIAVVAEVWPDGAITTIDGDAGPEPDGALAAVFNGPYLPAHSLSYNGMPIYAFARP